MALTNIFYASDHQGVIIDSITGIVSPDQLFLRNGPGLPSFAGVIGYRMPACTIRNLRILILGFSGFPSGIDFEVYKNNAPTGLKIPAVVAVPPPPVAFQDLINAAVFAAGDGLDLTLKPVNNGELGSCQFSATVERF